jgi:hypothetical protein
MGPAPVAFFGVISDISGPNEFLSTEILNLSARRMLPSHAIEKSSALSRPFGGFRALIYADEQPPEEALRRKLFVHLRIGVRVVLLLGARTSCGYCVSNRVTDDHGRLDPAKRA